MAKSILTAERVRELLHYDPDTGVFTWLSGQDSGKRAGWIDHGYVRIAVDGAKRYAHRLAWLYVHGEWPKYIDHINHVKSDNAIANLRPCTHQENMQNMRIVARSYNSTGLAGVSRFRGKFRSVIDVGGKQRHLGTFNTADSAHVAYLVAKAKFHPHGDCGGVTITETKPVPAVKP